MKRMVVGFVIAALGAAFAVAQVPAGALEQETGLDLEALGGEIVDEASMLLVAGGRPPGWTFDDDGSEPWNQRGRPVDNGGRVSSPTGPREPIVTGGGTTGDTHRGTDLPAAAGTPVTAARTGVVTDVNSSEQLGGKIVVRNLDGSTSEYTHVTPAVVKGDVVKVGSPVAKVGRTGAGEDGGSLSTGPHLHYGETDRAGRVVETSRVMGWSRGRNPDR